METTTKHGYVSKINKHVRPTLGDLPVVKVDVETLDAFNARLGRCRDQCNGSGSFSTGRPPPTARSAALSVGAGSESIQQATRILPHSPTRIPTRRHWGSYVWSSVTVGARRGEMCALHITDMQRATAGSRSRIAVRVLRGTYPDVSITTSHEPDLASRVTSRSLSRSPRTTSTPWTSSPVFPRLKVVTRAPADEKASTIARPTNAVPPSTNTFTAR